MYNQDNMVTKTGFDERLKFYLNAIARTQCGVYHLTGKDALFVCRANMGSKEFRKSLRHYSYGRNWTDHTQSEALMFLYRAYIRPCLRSAAIVDPDAIVVVRAGDNAEGSFVPCFGKSRPLYDKSNFVLLKLNAGRHFGMIPSVDAVDRPFGEKKNRLIWRGATTGNFRQTYRLDKIGSRRFIPNLMSRLPESRYDIGFSKLTASMSRTSESDYLRKYVKEKLDLSKQLENKYILVLEGNDVSSGLKWALWSNSVVLMPAPRCVSWACEHLLKPMQHFVPVAHDLSDLETVLEWCTENDEKCVKISEAARSHMELIMQSDDSLIEAVVSETLQKVRYVGDLVDIIHGEI